MPTVVVPFRGSEGKSRLGRLPLGSRATLREAMLADVLAAAEAVGPTFVARSARGQGAAVEEELDAAVRSGGTPPYLVVNADVPCATARDLLTLAGAVPPGGLALVAAADGTTNALAFSSRDLYAPVYGRGSAARFAALAPSRILDVPNLADDVDTLDDLERLRDRLGPNTRNALARLEAGAAA